MTGWVIKWGAPDRPGCLLALPVKLLGQLAHKLGITRRSRGAVIPMREGTSWL